MNYLVNEFATNQLKSIYNKMKNECYKRLNLPFAKDYWDNKDVINVISVKDLIDLLTLIKRIGFK